MKMKTMKQQKAGKSKIASSLPTDLEDISLENMRKHRISNMAMLCSTNSSKRSAMHLSRSFGTHLFSFPLPLSLDFPGTIGLVTP